MILEGEKEREMAEKEEEREWRIGKQGDKEEQRRESERKKKEWRRRGEKRIRKKWEDGKEDENEGIGKRDWKDERE